MKAPSTDGKGDKEEVAGGKEEEEDEKLHARGRCEKEDGGTDVAEEGGMSRRVAQAGEGESEGDE